MATQKVRIDVVEIVTQPSEPPYARVDVTHTDVTGKVTRVERNVILAAGDSLEVEIDSVIRSRGPSAN